jgi:hypothetical protein
MSDTTLEGSVASSGPDKFYKALFAGVWMAIILGLLVQGAVFGAKIGAGGKVPGAQLLVDVASGITWAMIVCGGVAIGTAASRNVSATMGLLGLAFAPIAFAAAKSVQRGISGFVGLPPEQLTPLLFQTGAVKAVEYALLGFILGRIIRTSKSTLTNHALIGLGFGVLFAAILVWLLFLNAAPGAAVPPPRVAGTAVNELIFPMGCSMVLYWVSQLATRGAAFARPT